MDKTIENETQTHNKEIVGLDYKPVIGSDGKETQTGSYLVSLLGIEDRKLLKKVMDETKVPVVARELIYSWLDASYELNEKAVPSWFLNPVDDTELGGREQTPCITSAPTFRPQDWRKRFKAIDLEHRKVTPDDDGNVSQYVQKFKDGEAVTRYDAQTGELEEVWEWSKSGRTLFNNAALKAMYNFVIRHIAMQDHTEGSFREAEERFIAKGGRTVEVKLNTKKLVKTMFTPLEQKSGKKIKVADGLELTVEEIESLAAQGKIMIEQGS